MKMSAASAPLMEKSEKILSPWHKAKEFDMTPDDGASHATVTARALLTLSASVASISSDFLNMMCFLLSSLNRVD